MKVPRSVQCAQNQPDKLRLDTGMLVPGLLRLLSPVATMIPGAEFLVEMVPERYGFSEVWS